MEKRYDVFISYSSEDQNVVEGICGYLERNGYRCFVAYRDIPRGIVWAAAITEAIDESTMMVVVFSKYFNNSPQTDREIELASENKMPILTYRIADDKMTGAKKYYLKILNWIDAFPNPENFYGQLLDCVLKLIGPKYLGDNKIDVEAEHKAKESAEREKLEWERKTNQATSIINGHEYVDLGLPSGTLWATCNLGAEKPEDCGDYLSWDDGKIATANCGTGWTMPTQEQWEELRRFTQNNWTTRNGVNGRLFTAKNGNSLFLPASGSRWGYEIYGAGSYGNYWSSSISTRYLYYAWHYYLDSRDHSSSDYCYGGRCFTIRPVRSAK